MGMNMLHRRQKGLACIQNVERGAELLRRLLVQVSQLRRPDQAERRRGLPGPPLSTSFSSVPINKPLR